MNDDFVRQNSADQDKKFDAEKLLVNGLDVYRLRIAFGSMAVRLDQVDANTLYIGEALPGTATSAASWRVRKVVVSGTQTNTLYANGSASFTNIWDNRTSLSYS